MAEHDRIPDIDKTYFQGDEPFHRFPAARVVVHNKLAVIGRLSGDIAGAIRSRLTPEGTRVLEYNPDPDSEELSWDGLGDHLVTLETAFEPGEPPITEDDVEVSEELPIEEHESRKKLIAAIAGGCILAAGVAVTVIVRNHRKESDVS